MLSLRPATLTWLLMMSTAGCRASPTKPPMQPTLMPMVVKACLSKEPPEPPEPPRCYKTELALCVESDKRLYLGAILDWSQQLRLWARLAWIACRVQP